MENEKVTTKAVSKDKKVEIRIPKAPVGEENYLTVSLNGKVFKLKRGEKIEVPDYIADIVEKSFEFQDEADEYLESLSK